MFSSALIKPHKSPVVWHRGGILWIQTKTNVLPMQFPCCMEYLVMDYHIIWQDLIVLVSKTMGFSSDPSNLFLFLKDPHTDT